VWKIFLAIITIPDQVLLSHRTLHSLSLNLPYIYPYKDWFNQHIQILYEDKVVSTLVSNSGNFAVYRSFFLAMSQYILAL